MAEDSSKNSTGVPSPSPPWGDFPMEYIKNDAKIKNVIGLFGKNAG